MLVHKPGCHVLSHPGGVRRPDSPGSGSGGGGARPCAKDAHARGGQEGALRPAGPHFSQRPTFWGVFASAKSKNIFSPLFLGPDSFKNALPRYVKRWFSDFPARFRLRK